MMGLHDAREGEHQSTAGDVTVHCAIMLNGAPRKRRRVWRKPVLASEVRPGASNSAVAYDVRRVMSDLDRLRIRLPGPAA
jgi:hypothetical protein